MKKVIFEKIQGKGDYYLYLKRDERGNIIESGDSDGKIAWHFFNEKNQLVETRHKTSFWRKYDYENDLPSKYSDSEGLAYELGKSPSIRGIHGTTLENALRIQKYGYDKTANQHWQQSNGNMYCFINSEYYSLNHCRNLAAKFALKAAKNNISNTALIELDVSSFKTRKYSVDMFDPSYELLDNILSENIIRVTSITYPFNEIK